MTMWDWFNVGLWVGGLLFVIWWHVLYQKYLRGDK
jgi:hypothetical protein